MRHRRDLAAATATLLLTMALATPASADPVFFGPTRYLGDASSSLQSASDLYWFLENFEDGLNTPGVAASGGFVIGFDPYIDSVDGDDGVVDGLGGTDGHSWYSNGLNSLTFTFDRDLLGVLPTHVGPSGPTSATTRRHRISGRSPSRP